MNQPISQEDKLLAALSYWGSIIIALIIFFLRKDNPSFVRKHALQAIMMNLVGIVLVGAGLSVIANLIGMLTLGLGGLLILLLQVIIGLVLFIYVVYLGIQVFQGEDPDIPYLTEMLRKNSDLL